MHDTAKPSLVRRPAITAEVLQQAVHDLRGPLGSVAVHLDLLQNQLGEGGPAARSTEKLRGAMERLRRMLAELSDLGEAIIEPPEALDALELVEAAVGSHPAGTERFDVTGDGGHKTVAGSRAVLLHGIAAALDGAARAVPAETAIPIRVSEAGRAVRIEIECRDGEASALRRSLQLDPPDLPGLFTIQAVLRSHGGDLLLEATAGAPRLIFHLPRHGDQSDA